MNLNGLNSLKEKISELFKLDQISTNDYTYLTNTRQISLAKKALQSLENAEQGTKNNDPIDMIEIDIKNAFDLLGEIVGKNYSDEILDNLFKNFCVGK
ncbi:MAG: tRNA uridine-5-carboxymethylaminomethyl(34) synthesis GTPase MnmE, partial [Bacilli bacterium]|nr:tRNA uridine-5-carboxymethylaminomethyl(34) synthesis GTPase MnmE [Bacilli bacterium]